MLCSAKDACNLISTIYGCPSCTRGATRLAKASCRRCRVRKRLWRSPQKHAQESAKRLGLPVRCDHLRAKQCRDTKSDAALSLLISHDHQLTTRYDQQLTSMPTLLITAAPCLAPGFFLRFPDRLFEYYTPTLRQFLGIVLDFAPRSPGVQFCSTKIKL